MKQSDQRGETIQPKAIKHSLQIPSFPALVSYHIQLLIMYFLQTKPVLIISFTRFEINILQLPWKIWTEKQPRR